MVDVDVKTNAAFQAHSNRLLASSSSKTSRRTKRFSRWVRRRLWSRQQEYNNNFLDLPCRIIPDHVALNIFDAMYAIEQHLWKTDASKIYSSTRSSAHLLTQFNECLMSSHQSDYQSKLNSSAVDTVYILGEAVKHTLSFFSPFVPSILRDNFTTIMDEKDVITFLDLDDWSRHPGKLVMGIFVHLSKISRLLLSKRDDPHKMALFTLSSIFSDILFPQGLSYHESAEDGKIFQSANVIRLSLILQCIHGMMPPETASCSLKDLHCSGVIKSSELSSLRNATETEKCTVLSTACSPIYGDCGDSTLQRKEKVLYPQQSVQMQLNINDYKGLIERAQNRIQSAKMTSNKVEQALYYSHVGAHIH
jgi:hypothetical protein